MIEPYQRPWHGIKANVTKVLSDFGVSQSQTNTDMQVEGELRRRYGYQSTSIAQQAGPVRSIMSAFPSGRPFVMFDIGGASAGTVTGFDAPDPPPPPKRRRPVVLAGTPQAPVILSVTPSPATPQAYPVGLVTWTVAVQYDGLSGPLIYSYAATDFDVYPNTSPAWVGGAGDTFTFDFNAGSLPGSYTKFFTGTVDTTLNGFSVPIGQIDFLVT